MIYYIHTHVLIYIFWITYILQLSFGHRWGWCQNICYSYGIVGFDPNWSAQRQSWVKLKFRIVTDVSHWMDRVIHVFFGAWDPLSLNIWRYLWNHPSHFSLAPHDAIHGSSHRCSYGGEFLWWNTPWWKDVAFEHRDQVESHRHEWKLLPKLQVERPSGFLPRKEHIKHRANCFKYSLTQFNGHAETSSSQAESC